jgi:hypothetical protein
MCSSKGARVDPLTPMAPRHQLLQTPKVQNGVMMVRDRHHPTADSGGRKV